MKTVTTQNPDIPENGKTQASKIKKRKLKLSLHRNYSKQKQKFKKLITGKIFWIKISECPSFSKINDIIRLWFIKIYNIDGTHWPNKTQRQTYKYILWSFKEELQDSNKNQIPRNHWHPTPCTLHFSPLPITENGLGKKGSPTKIHKILLKPHDVSALWK